MQCVQVQWRCSISLVEHQAHAYLYPAYLYLVAPCAPALALVDQAVAALILPSNNIELAGGVPEPRAGAAGTADGRAQVVQAMA